MAQLLLPLSRAGFLLAIGMGFLLFSADASHVVKNPAFQSKLLLIAAALVNVVIAHAGPWRQIESWHDEAPGGAKATALISLVLWLGAICAGRLDRLFLMEAAMHRRCLAILALLIGFCGTAGGRPRQ